MDRVVLEVNGRDASAFPPKAIAVATAQVSQLPDRPPNRDRLDIAYRADDLKVHRPNLARRTAGLSDDGLQILRAFESPEFAIECAERQVPNLAGDLDQEAIWKPGPPA